MSKLKPIGSEKLQGDAKLNRMLEIAMYKEVDKQNINETSSKEYDIQLTDGNVYAIVKEKVGYVIKRGLNESTLDYIDPIRNRKYYRSYSQAFKKLNLITKELNELYDNPSGVSLFGEQKKYTLKTPKPAQPDNEMGDMPAPPSEPPAVPNPELPPSPLEGGEGQIPPPAEPGMEGQMPPPAEPGMEGQMPDMGGMDDMGDEMPDMEDEPKQDKGDEEVTFKTIQKLTGRLTQKIRTLENEEGLTSEEVKYVINMVISSLNIDILDEEDVDDIISKFEGGGEEGDMGDEMPDMEGEMPDMEGIEGEMPDMEGIEGEMPNMGGMPQGGGEEYVPKKRYAESKVDRIISNYFELSSQEKVLSEQRKLKLEKSLNENLKSIKLLSETQKQYSAANEFLNKFKRFKVMGKTNLGNIMLKLNENTIKITKQGEIIK